MRTASIVANTFEVFLLFMIVLPFLDFFGGDNAIYINSLGARIFLMLPEKRISLFALS